jgi:predicted DNA-binding transcriptional regulator AlpA
MTTHNGVPRPMRGQAPRAPASTLDTSEPSSPTTPVPQTDHCFSKQQLAAYLGVSTRTLDRAAAMGLLPRPDLQVGRSPRWSPETVTKWLRTRPKLPGRGGRP